MKNLKFSLFTMVLIIVAISSTSCGDESSDPQPVKVETLDLSIEKTDVSAFDGSDGIITVTVLGDVAAFDFSKDNGVTFETGKSPFTFKGLKAGIYTIAVRDVNKEVVKSNPITLNQPENPLTAVKAYLQGSKWDLVKSEVTDGIEPLQTFTATESCTTTGKYVASIENIGLEFIDGSKITYKNYCLANNNFEFKYTVTEINSTTFSVQVKNNQDRIVIDAELLKSDIFDTEGKVKSEIKMKFKEIESPANWKYSPTLYFKKL